MPVQLTGILRENVAAVIMRPDGAILMGESAKQPGSWSFPQGGVDPGETRREAMFREVREEVGLVARSLRVLRSRGGYTYLYPGGRLKKGIYSGQIQTYFLCLLLRDDPYARMTRAGKPHEFLAVDWVRPEKVALERVPGFKREVTRAVLRDFFGVDVALPVGDADDEDDTEYLL